MGAGGTGCYPSGKYSGGRRGPAGLNPCPHQEDTLEQASAPPASRNPCPPRGGGGSIRQGAPRAAPVPEVPLCLPGLPHQGRAQDPVAGDEPLPGADTRPVEKRPPAPGDRVAFVPLSPTSRRKPRSASRRSVTSKEGTRSAVGLRYRVGEGAPRLCPNFRRKATSPRARTDARTPTALGVQSPPPCCHQAPGPRQRLPPAAAEPSAACSPSRRPPRPAYPRAPRRALASYPLCDQRRPAADAGWLLKENLAGCPPGHPRPSISGGDPSRAGTVGREHRAQGPH